MIAYDYKKVKRPLTNLYNCTQAIFLVSLYEYKAKSKAARHNELLQISAQLIWSVQYTLYTHNAALIDEDEGQAT